MSCDKLPSLLRVHGKWDRLSEGLEQEGLLRKTHLERRIATLQAELKHEKNIDDSLRAEVNQLKHSIETQAKSLLDAAEEQDSTKRKSLQGLKWVVSSQLEALRLEQRHSQGQACSRIAQKEQHIRRKYLLECDSAFKKELQQYQQVLSDVSVLRDAIYQEGQSRAKAGRETGRRLACELGEVVQVCEEGYGQWRSSLHSLQVGLARVADQFGQGLAEERAERTRFVDGLLSLLEQTYQRIK